MAKLRQFNPNAVGPQGDGGIPPESFGQHLSEEERMAQDPERAKASQDVIDKEIDETMQGALGVKPDQAPPAAVTESAAQTPPATETEPVTEEPQGIAAIMKKYDNNIGKMAEGYGELEKARKRAQSTGMKREDELQKKIEDLEGQMAAVLTPRPQRPETTVPEVPAATPGEPTDWSWENPAKSIRSIVDNAVQQNLVAIEQARAQRDEADRLKKTTAENAEELGRLRPVMAKLYMEDRDIYDGMPQSRALDHLMRRAQEVDAANQAVQFYRDIQGLESDTPGEAPGPANLGSLPTNGAASTRTSAGSPARPSNWSETPKMKKLWRTSSDSMDESRTILDVLEERGFGDHIK
jgi:hypothetical protein